MFNITEKVYEEKRRKIKQYPCKSNRASELGHPCERYLVYNRTSWMQKAPHSVETQFLFDHGNWVEKEALQELMDSGFEITESQRALSINGNGENITGHIDLKISNGSGESFPCEIKGLSHWDWIKLYTIDDFFKSEKPWIKKYPAQLMLYMHGTGSRKGVFYIKDKQAPHLPKDIWIDLDASYVDELMKKALRIESHVTNKTLPDRIPYHSKVCGYCAFNIICLPDASYGEGVCLSDDKDLEDMLDRSEEISSIASEYEKLKKSINEKVTGKPHVLCGKWIVTGRYIERKASQVKATKYWSKTIREV